MKIAIIGYGKMGKTIEQLAQQNGHEVLLKIDANNTQDFQLANLQKADVAIEFSRPDTAYSNIMHCFEANIPVVCGTTAWLDQYDKVVDYCQKNNQAFFYASNFSIGVNIFFEINKKLAALMNHQKGYRVQLEEIHHIQKLDAPSGTAISLAEGIIENSEKTSWVTEKEGEHFEVPVYSKRINEVPGTHIIDYSSNVDSIKIEHVAHNRNGFALGAVIAAEWIINKKGVFKMKDVLNL
jgi:4-hydroxy-tetrahydrodipicolinate reductase